MLHYQQYRHMQIKNIIYYSNLISYRNSSSCFWLNAFPFLFFSLISEVLEFWCFCFLLKFLVQNYEFVMCSVISKYTHTDKATSNCIGSLCKSNSSMIVLFSKFHGFSLLIFFHHRNQYGKIKISFHHIILYKI